MGHRGIHGQTLVGTKVASSAGRIFILAG